ncbi:EpsG family protein [Tessaracoccus sp. Y36]
MVTYYGVIASVLLLSLAAEWTRGTAVETDLSARNDLSYIRRVLIGCVGVLLTLVAALRWRVGTDYRVYERLYPSYRDGFMDALVKVDEPAFKLLALISSWIYDDAATMFFFASLLAVGTAVCALAARGGPVAFIFGLYILSGSWHLSFNAVRQAIAIAIVFAGHRFILQRKFILYLLIVGVASLFHASAVVALPLFWVPRRRLGGWGLSFAAALAVTGYVFSGQLLQLVLQLAEADVSVYVTQVVSPLRVVVAVAPVLVYLLWLRAEDRDPSAWFYRNLSIVHAAIAIPFSVSAYLYRYTLYTLIFVPLSLASLTAFREPLSRQWVRLAITLLFAIFWYLEVTGSPDLHAFSWIWERQ